MSLDETSRSEFQDSESIPEVSSNRVTKFGSPIQKDESIVVQHRFEVTAFEVTQLYATRAAGNSEWVAREILEVSLE